MIADSGASYHQFNRLDWFDKMWISETSEAIISASGHTLKLTTIGVATLRVQCPDKGETVAMVQRYFNLHSPCNLISADQLRADGLMIDRKDDALIHKVSRTLVAYLD